MPRAAPSVVSVVVWAHNDADGLLETVDSALRCSVTCPLEIVAVNGGSTDGTWRRLLEVKSRHPEVHLVDLDSSHGEGFARLEGARRAAGDLIAFAATGADPAVLATVVAASRPRR